MRDFEMLRQRIKQNPADVAALNSLGIIYARAGKLEDGIRLWRYALNIDPAYVHLYNNLGSALKQQGRRDEARIVFKTGLTRSQSYWIYYNLGLLEKEEGSQIAAANCFKSCLENNPNFQPAIKQLEEMGYHTRHASLPQTRPMSLGSFKPPVETGNIDFYPLMPDGQEERPARRTAESGYSSGSRLQVPRVKPAPVPAKILSEAECIELVKSYNADPKDRYLALTFDDGPHHTNTREILDILRREGARATFFVVGSRAETYPDLISRMAAEGHDVGNHTWEHRSLTKSSRSDALTSLQRTSDLVSGLTSKPCNIVRPPFGQTSSKVKEMLHSQGWHEILWDSDSRDWENKNPDRILYRVMKSAGPGSIVLFHDIHPGAAVMLPTMIRAFRANGYRFITISDLIALSSSS
jgi:peptidoglycan/xylan/chitin deacetylase (PgdA/CDA1 family)